MKKISGIYKIVNIVNNKLYIGKAFNINNRFRRHIYELNNNKHNNEHLQSVWNKYGEKNFKFEILKECHIDDLNDNEEYFIRYYSSNNRKYGYNKTIGGDGGDTFTNNIRKEEIREKQSKALKGRTPWNKDKHNCFDECAIQKISSANTGKKRTLEQRQNISNAVKGKKRSDTVRQNISNGKKGKSHVAPSDETIEKIRQSNLGKKRSEETRQNISNSKKGKKLSQEHKDKMSASMKGKNTFKRSEETKQKLSEIRKNIWKDEEYRKKYSEKHKKIKDEQIEEILLEIKEGKKLQKDIAKKYNISPSMISQYKKLYLIN